MASALLRLPAVLERTGLKRSALLLLMQRSNFPAPLKLGTRINVWPSSEVDAWVDDQIATLPRKTFRRSAAS